MPLVKKGGRLDDRSFNNARLSWTFPFLCNKNTVNINIEAAF